MQKLVPSSQAQLRHFAREHHSCEETLQQWRDVGGNVSGSASAAIEPSTHHADTDMFNFCTN